MDRHANSQSPANNAPENVRRDVRLAAPAELRCILRSAPAVFKLNNISTGGFGASANMPLGRDAVYEFEFSLHDLCVVRLARVVHCAWVEGEHWNLGAAFQPGGAAPTIEQLIDRITESALDFG